MERAESDPKPNHTSYGSSEEEIWRAAATKFKFLGLQPIAVFETLCQLYPKDFRDEYYDEMVDIFKLLLGERLEKHPRSVPLYILAEYRGIITSSFAMRLQKIEIPWFR